MRLARILFAGLLLFPAIVATAETPDTGEPAIKVDLNQTGLIEVELNVKEKPTLWIEAVNGDTPVEATFNVEGTAFDPTSDLLLQFLPCKGSRDKQLKTTLGRAASPLPDCSFIVVRDEANTRRATVIGPPDGMEISVTGTSSDGTPKTRFLKLELNYRYFGLSYSGGLMLSGQRDDRYTLEPAAAPAATGTQTAVKQGQEDMKRAIIALATVSLNGKPSLGFSFGVGTESAELNALSLLAAGTFTVRPRHIVDAVLFSIGAAYLPRTTLKPEFTGNGKIPAGVELKDVVGVRRSVKPFISVTFRSSGNAAAVRTPLGGTPSQ